jgi:transcription-repair coupling factor (superfamily II helicase)
MLATHDLEIRGAGELLGESQSGEMTEVGLSMYLDMLERAVKALQSGKQPAVDATTAPGTEIELRVPSLLPEDYVGDVPVRLTLYKRIAAAADGAALAALTEELVDRFGELPPPTQNLLAIARLKLAARPLGIRRLDLSPDGGYVSFETENTVDPARVIKLIQQPNREYRLDGPLKLRVARDLDEDAERFAYASELLRKLGAPETV